MRIRARSCTGAKLGALVVSPARPPGVPSGLLAFSLLGTACVSVEGARVGVEVLWKRVWTGIT